MGYSPIQVTSYYIKLFLGDTFINPSLFIMVVARFVSTNLKRSEALALVTMEPKVRSFWMNSEAVWCVSTSFNISISISIHIATLWVSYCWCRISAFKPVGFVSEMDFIWYTAVLVHLHTVYLIFTLLNVTWLHNSDWFKSFGHVKQFGWSKRRQCSLDCW